jgi:hypothetical protein
MRTKETKKTVRVTVTLDQDACKRIAHLAIHARMSKSGFLPHVIDCGVASLEKSGVKTRADAREIMQSLRKEKSHA